MSEETTQSMPTDGGQSFEKRVFARFDTLDSGLRNVRADLGGVDARLQKLEAHAYDTKPIWEQALKEIIETRRELSRRLDRIEAIAHETRADSRDAEDRIAKLESEPAR